MVTAATVAITVFEIPILNAHGGYSCASCWKIFMSYKYHIFHRHTQSVFTVVTAVLITSPQHRPHQHKYRHQQHCHQNRQQCAVVVSIASLQLQQRLLANVGSAGNDRCFHASLLPCVLHRFELLCINRIALPCNQFTRRAMVPGFVLA